MPYNLDTAQLRTFVIVADTASMTAAGNALHLTQGAISQQIKRLEDALGCSLFDRDRRGLRLTSAGERLFGKAKQLLSLNDEIWSEMTAAGVEGRVRVGVPPDLVGVCLAPVLKTYTEAFPHVSISLRSDASPDLAAALATGEIDVALIEQPAATATGECLGVEQLVWVGARGGTVHRKRPLPISLIAETCAFRASVLAALQGHGISWRSVFENGSTEATLATVRGDLAVTTWLATLVPPGLEIIDDTDLPPLPRFAITLHLPRHDIDAPTREFARLLRESLPRLRWAA